MVSAGRFYTVLLQSDGLAVACGRYIEGQCRIPPLHEGVKYTQVSAGDYHTVLVRSDGCAVESSLPPLDEGVTYTQVSASYDHMMLLRSDGSAVACGWNNFGQCEILSLKYLRNWFPFWVPSLSYVSDWLGFKISHKLALADEQQLPVVLPDGQLLEAVCAADPSVTLETLCLKHEKAWKRFLHAGFKGFCRWVLGIGLRLAQCCIKMRHDKNNNNDNKQTPTHTHTRIIIYNIYIYV